MSKKICISGYYGFNNFGDETILEVLIKNLKQFQEKPSITVFSSSPEQTSKNLNVNSIYSFNIKSVLKELFTCDCLISGGGSLLQNSTSSKSLIYYLAVIFLAQLFGKKVIIFAQGIGPIKNKLLLNLTMFILRRSAYITVRDITSFNLLKKYKINANLCNDPVWNIQKIQKPSLSTNKIGIQLRSFNNVSDNFINELATLINKYYSNKEICIFSLQNKQDCDICKQLKDNLLKINSDLNVNFVENTSNQKIINDIASLDELIAMRYHACLIAIKNRVKLLPLSYDMKVETLAKEFNLDYVDMTKKQDLAEIFENFAKKNIEYNEEKINEQFFDFKELEKNI